MNASGDLFPEPADQTPRCERLRAGAVVLRRFALADGPALLDGLTGIITQAPLRHMTTPGGFRMSVSMTNCGTLGWITDRSGYRYAEVDPESGRRWPAMPAVFTSLAARAAARAGYGDFVPDACLINRYQPGARDDSPARVLARQKRAANGQSCSAALQRQVDEPRDKLGG
jgi:DNA oxidative demethylase